MVTRFFPFLIAASTLLGCAAQPEHPDKNQVTVEVIELPPPSFAELKQYTRSDIADIRPSYQTHVCVDCDANSYSFANQRTVWIMLKEADAEEFDVQQTKQFEYRDELGAKHFSFDSYRLVGDLAPLKKAVFFHNENPSALIKVVGNTDSRGSNEYNYKLGMRRAMAVKQWLIKQGIPEDHIDASSMGETNPIASNNTAAGRQKNRRADLVVTINIK